MALSHLTRRQILASLGALPAVSFAWPRLTLAAAPGPSENRLVVVILRGGMDGLAAVAPYDDPDYRKQRRDLALGAPGKDGGVLDLGGGFGLHPALKTLHRLHKDGQFRAVHAIATPYRDRSHFSAQDVLENGSAADLAIKDGWLNRALPVMSESAMALGQTIPLVLRGNAEVSSWAPSILPAVNADTLDRIGMLYENDPLFGPALQNAIAANEIAGNAVDEAKGARRFGPRGRFITVMEAAGKFVRKDDGPRIATVELTGWDTHAGQGAAHGRLARQLGILDDGIAALERELGPAWARTVVVAVTEFGRTVAMNGTGGTDHGTASVALLMGGAVNGGPVVAEWPGLRTRDLHEARDLRPTIDMRALAKGLLHDHMGLARSHLDQTVFPDSAGVIPISDLVT